MNKLLSIFWMAKRNFIIDAKFISRTAYLPGSERFELIVKKYYSLVVHFFKPYATGKSNVTISGKKIFYNTRYGLVGYQCMLAEQIYWVAKLKLTGRPVILDIGANVGYFTMGCKKLNRDTTVFAFEPAAPAYMALEKNVNGESDIRLFNIALGNENKTVKLDVDYAQTSFSKVSHDTKGIDIPMNTLDSIIDGEACEHIDLIKLDTEGYELNVLKGAIHTLKKTNYLLMELNPGEYSLTQITDILRTAGKEMKLLFVRNFDLSGDSEFTSGDALFELSDIKAS